MEFLGTKDKWRVSSDFTQITTSKKGILEGSKKICEMSDFSKRPEETKANALLISKSPEMLDMLKDILEAQENGEAFHSYKIEQLIKESTEFDEPKNGDSITSNIYK